MPAMSLLLRQEAREALRQSEPGHDQNQNAREQQERYETFCQETGIDIPTDDRKSRIGFLFIH